MTRKQAIARLKLRDKKFEVIVDPDKAWLFKKGEKDVDIHDVLLGEFIYYDARRGLKASEIELKQIFKTDDVYKVAEHIVRQGELQLTAEQRREMIEAKKRQIIEFISRNCIDPRTGLPHPPKRIELAIENARVSIDPFKPVEVQVNEVIKALVRVLPLKMAKTLVAVKIPPQYVGKAYGVLSKIGKIIRSNYLSDGSWSVELEIPAGLQGTLVEEVAKMTKGRGEVRIIKSATS
ncbi:MAG: ribosome assembly factor SBDS [Thermoprotei archaeon]|nr:MAG: ribosome assembly factor SBDS [Thermoprotei archaeon]